jgi:hypothetical protein
MTAIPLRQPTADELHEQRIQAAYDEWLNHSRTRPGLWTKLVDLINQRSEQQIERMERAKGIR